jgi:signal transduction histidine kinase
MNPRLASLLRRPAVLDAGAAALLAALALLVGWRVTFPPPRADRELILLFGSVGAWRWQVPAWWAASVVALAALPLRHRFPVIAFGLTLAMATAHSLVLALGPSPVDFAVAITAYTLASARPQRTSAGVLGVGGALAVTAYVVGLAAIARGPGQDTVLRAGERQQAVLQTWSWAGDWLGRPGNAVVPALLALVVVAAWFAGRGARARRAYLAEVERRARDAERDRDRQADLAAAAERARITGELHDVIAHALSVMVIQAQGAGAALRRRHPEDTAGALDAIVATGRDALAETRRLLGVVRRPPAAGLELAPQPDLAGLPGLVAKVRQAGTPVQLRIAGAARRLAPGVELSAYRIIQEALTNTIKHGGPAATAAVSVRYGDDDLTVEVTDDGAGPAAGNGWAHHGGQGLPGMRARAAMLGGQLSAGPAVPAGFRVAATLPLPPAPDPEVPAR